MQCARTIHLHPTNDHSKASNLEASRFIAKRNSAVRSYYGQHTVYVARSATGCESGPPNDIRCALVARTSVQTREKGLDNVGCLGHSNSATMSWRGQIAVMCRNGCRRAAEPLIWGQAACNANTIVDKRRRGRVACNATG